MRLLSGLMLLLPLMSPLAHAELIDDVNDRGELRIALDAASPPWSFKQDGQLTGFDVELGELFQPVADRGHLDFVELAGGFLAVAGDKRHRGALGQQLRRGGDLKDLDAELLREAHDVLGIRLFRRGSDRCIGHARKSRRVQRPTPASQGQTACGKL